MTTMSRWLGRKLLRLIWEKALHSGLLVVSIALTKSARPRSKYSTTRPAASGETIGAEYSMEVVVFNTLCMDSPQSSYSRLLTRTRRSQPASIISRVIGDTRNACESLRRRKLQSEPYLATCGI